MKRRRRPILTIMPCLLALAVLVPSRAAAWWDIWPWEEHQWMADRAVDIAMERFPELAAEIDQYREQIMDGTHDEDFDSDPSFGSSADYSALCPAVPRAYWPIAQLPLNAIQWIHAAVNPCSWEKAIGAYPSDKATAYYRLGRVMHNLQDLFVPAHVYVAPHGLGSGGLVYNHSWPLYFDNFEQWCEVNDHELGLANPDLIPVRLRNVNRLMAVAAYFTFRDAPGKNYYPSSYYDPPDRKGEWGKYIPHPYGGYPSGYDSIDNELANDWSLRQVPRCCEFCAALIKVYWDKVNVSLPPN